MRRTAIRPRTAPGAPRGSHPEGARPLAAGLVVIAAGLAAVAVLGPLLTGAVDYRITETLRNQTIGLDAVSLLVVAPLALWAAALALRGRPLGPAIALGVGAYTAYMLVQYVVGPDYADLPGDNERLFPLLLVLFAAGWLVALAGWLRLRDALPGVPATPRRDRILGWYVLPPLATLAFVRYLPSLADWMRADPADAGYLAGPSFAWIIALLDLGVFLPLTVMACVALVRGRSWARILLCLVTGWFGLVGLAVAAMAIAMYANDDPNASAGQVAFMTGLGAAFTAVAVAVLIPFAARRR